MKKVTVVSLAYVAMQVSLFGLTRSRLADSEITLGALRLELIPNFLQNRPSNGLGALLFLRYRGVYNTRIRKQSLRPINLVECVSCLPCGCYLNHSNIDEPPVRYFRYTTSIVKT